MTLVIRDAQPADLPAILAIVNDAILNTTAMWTLTPATLEQRQAWLAERQDAGLPVVVAVQGPELVGFASFGPFRPWEGYAATVEHSVYVDANRRGQGAGRRLMEALVARAEAMGLHVMVGGIEAGNAASIALHERLGFERVGLMPEVGRKFGRWLDLLFMQRILR